MNQLESTLEFLKSSIPEVEHLILNMDGFKINPEIIVKFNTNSNIPDLVLEYDSFDKNHFMLELKVEVLEYLKKSKASCNIKGKIVWDAGFVYAPYNPRSKYRVMLKHYINKICNFFKSKKTVKRYSCVENATVEFRSKSRIN